MFGWMKRLFNRIPSKSTAPIDLPWVCISPVPIKSTVIFPIPATITNEEVKLEDLSEIKPKRRIRRTAKRTPRLKGSTDQT